MEEDEFEEHVRAALDTLPADLARGLENVAVVVEDEHPGDPGLFGTFHGVPRTERSSFGPAMPATITIYRRPLEDAFPDPDELEREIRITVLHELAHYFGIDEERIDELGYR
jgi:predicted Zn-dependent protease with MMP-like domain